MQSTHRCRQGSHTYMESNGGCPPEAQCVCGCTKGERAEPRCMQDHHVARLSACVQKYGQLHVLAVKLHGWDACTVVLILSQGQQWLARLCGFGWCGRQGRGTQVVHALCALHGEVPCQPLGGPRSLVTATSCTITRALDAAAGPRLCSRSRLR